MKYSIEIARASQAGLEKGCSDRSKYNSSEHTSYILLQGTFQ